MGEGQRPEKKPSGWWLDKKNFEHRFDQPSSTEEGQKPPKGEKPVGWWLDEKIFEHRFDQPWPKPEEKLFEPAGKYIKLGFRSVYYEEPIPVYLAYDDRVGHLAIFGQTGVGKSTFIHNLVHQDIRQHPIRRCNYLFQDDRTQHRQQ